MQHRERSVHGRLGLALFVGLVLMVLAACGGNGEQTGDVKATGTLEGAGQEIVFFSGPRSSPYTIELSKAIEERGQSLGYKVRTIESPTPDQPTQDALIRQYLSTGAKPAAFIWAPQDTNAAAASARAMAAVSPLFQTNSDVVESSRKFVKAFGGVNDVQVGRNAAEVLMRQREKDRKAGVELKSKQGNLLVLTMPSGFQGTILREKGFEEATADEPFNVIHAEYGPYYAVQLAYDNAAQLIPKYKGKIDYIFIGGNTGAAEGTIRALRQNGLEPGRDVKIVTGTCNGGGVDLINKGEIIGTSLQSPWAEGTTAVNMVAQYLAAGGSKAGVTTLENAPQVPKIKIEAPVVRTFIPMPVVTTAEEFKSANVWGRGAREICGEP